MVRAGKIPGIFSKKARLFFIKAFLSGFSNMPPTVKLNDPVIASSGKHLIVDS